MLIWKFHLHSGKHIPSQIDNDTLLKFSKQQRVGQAGFGFLVPSG